MNEPALPGIRYAWFVVGILMLANVSSFIDRQILSLLVRPIKRDLQLSDFEISLLMGLSFALFYTFFGMVIGRLADQYNRRNIIIAGITIWSLMTALCGGVKTYSQFFLARMGVGIGEATLSPSAYSIISDYFPKHKLATALSIYSLGIFLGSGIAMLVGAGIIAQLPTEGLIAVPVFGNIYPWQLLFVYIAVPGLIIALLLFLIKEPKRKGMMVQDGQIKKMNTREALSIILKKKSAFWGVCLGATFSALCSYGLSAWVPTYLQRTFEWSIPKSGLYYGAVVVISSLLGVLWGGWYADKLIKKNHLTGRLRVGIISAAGIFISCLIPLIPDGNLAVLAFSIPGFFIASNIGISAAAIQELLPNQVRAFASSIFLFVLNLVALGAGPTLVASCTDFIFKDEGALKYSLAILLFIGGSFSITGFMAAIKKYRSEMEFPNPII